MYSAQGLMGFAITIENRLIARIMTAECPACDLESQSFQRGHGFGGRWLGCVRVADKEQQKRLNAVYNNCLKEY